MGREARSLEDWVRWHRCENVCRSTLASQKPFLPGIIKSIHPVPPELELNLCTGSIATLSHLPKAFLQSSPMCDYDESKLENYLYQADVHQCVPSAIQNICRIGLPTVV